MELGFAWARRRWCDLVNQFKQLPPDLSEAFEATHGLFIQFNLMPRQRDGEADADALSRIHQWLKRLREVCPRAHKALEPIRAELAASNSQHPAACLRLHQAAFHLGMLLMFLDEGSPCYLPAEERVPAKLLPFLHEAMQEETAFLKDRWNVRLLIESEIAGVWRRRQEFGAPSEIRAPTVGTEDLSMPSERPKGVFHSLDETSRRTLMAALGNWMLASSAYGSGQNTSVEGLREATQGVLTRLESIDPASSLPFARLLDACGKMSLE